MNIGVIGWWHHDNQGDSVMLDALRRSLAPHKLVPLDTDLEYNQDTLTRLNRLDFLLLGGGTLIRGQPLPLFRDFQRWGGRLSVPLGVLGLGVTHVEPDSSAGIRALIEQSRFFYVRDETSHRLLDHPSVQLAPDLSFAWPLPYCARPLSSRESPLGGINLRHTNEMDVAAWADALRELPCRWRGLPLSSFSAWREQQGLRTLDPNCAPAFSANLYRGLDLVVGTALHAVIFAVQAGVPVIAIDYASKVRRFMVEIGLADYVLAADDIAGLPDVYGRLLEHHEVIRQTLRRRRAQLVEESQSMFAAVRLAVETIPPPEPGQGKLVSVLVVGGDSADALEQTLISCREQIYPDIETIIVSDTSPAVPEGAARLVQTFPAAGLAERLNAGLAEASGAYATWLLAGDCLAADAISLLVDRLEQAQADLVYANYYLAENGKIESQKPAHPPYKLKRHDIVTPCFLYRRLLHDTVGPYDSRSSMPSYDFWLRVAVGHRLCHVRTPLLLAQRRPSNSEESLERVVRRDHFSTRPLADRLLWKCLDNYLANQLLPRARGVRRPSDRR